ncbi:MAG TPA: class F sortase [Lapillicoccus sp.]|nr:class F sortase [Lapillicoccus sp.]
MRTIAVLLAVVGVVLVVGDLRSRAGLDVALGPRPLAAPCEPGAPARMSIPAIGVDAPVETIGLDRRGTLDASGRAPLAAPVDQRKVGWYADGPKPGSGTGTVLTNGHTYRDGSAVFQQDFPTRVQVGQEVDLVLDNGTTCRYRITTVWRDVDATNGYPQLVAGEGLYDQTGPERLFLETCSGPWLSSERRFEDITVVLATPVAT